MSSAITLFRYDGSTWIFSYINRVMQSTEIYKESWRTFLVLIFCTHQLSTIFLSFSYYYGTNFPSLSINVSFVVWLSKILTQEDWQEVLYNGMSKTSQWSALYFIALMTFGNYVLFNLLVAILVEGFSAEGEVRNLISSDNKGRSFTSTANKPVDEHFQTSNYHNTSAAVAWKFWNFFCRICI